ncbi:hypothetical protein OX283_006510 [Flavobacterium sp. SUN052]|uniref:hypothetical protein n=1 Tax=Flavobacterium sp. SUN052 TaxID=3002441 RepID=UPI00237EC3B0|nr:hypothetical protein [Flavobacterium sp. SUN052]MEC4004301.1 hypothetical protein [Flavobacterium sp. SUN052]
MKYLTLVVLFSFLSCNKSLYKNQIGVKTKDRFEVSIDTNKLKIDWNNILAENNIEGKISDFVIKSGIDDKNNKKYYYLFSKSKDNKIKMVSKIIKKGNLFFIDSIDQRYIICHNCSDSYPKIYDNLWACETENFFECKKTEVIKF